jgi:hypothetical protein
LPESVVTVPVLPEVAFGSLWPEAVPSAPPAGREPVSTPLYSRIWRPPWAFTLVVTVTV